MIIIVLTGGVISINFLHSTTNIIILQSQSARFGDTSHITFTAKVAPSEARLGLCRSKRMQVSAISHCPWTMSDGLYLEARPRPHSKTHRPTPSSSSTTAQQQQQPTCSQGGRGKTRNVQSTVLEASAEWWSLVLSVGDDFTLVWLIDVAS